ncbi:MAG: DUF1707 domain-containing protein [Solirubrobacteraceae bacterium]|nr:DUF1707 domain-containing protein [Solirubrobacteraceae bacterium]
MTEPGGPPERRVPWGRPQTPAIRASDAERDATIERLRDAAGEGRLTFEELADRLDDAARSVHRADLDRLVADLPAPPPAPARGVAVPTTAPTVESTVFGDLRRGGAWVVPAHSRWRATFGDIVLDLRAARVDGDEITIDVRTVFGDITLLTPEGVAVDVRARARMGSVRQDAGHVAATGAPRVVLTGRTWFGDIRIRSKRLRDRVVDAILGRR